MRLGTGRTHVHKHMPQVLQLILDGKVKPSVVVTHHVQLDPAPDSYKIFREKKEDSLKIIITFRG